jgi:septal ring factor EnvC (AmiA/AmiB activator)
MKIPVEEKYWFNFLSSEHYYQFLVLVYNPANAEMGKKNYKAKYAGVRDDFNQKLNKVYGEKSLLNQKLQQTYREKSELNEKLKLTYGEKSQLNAKLQQTYKEKSEINAKLQQTYKEKSEINKNLRKTCEALESSSQQNAQLQQRIDELQQQLDHPTFAYLKGKLWDKIKAKLSKK